jgi:cellulose synthase/poly-beta-1,6-N-acetylglucosamine synthase-like glycosyltransferase
MPFGVSWSDALLSALAIPVVLGSVYLCLLALLAEPEAPPPPGRGIRFDVVVPAHNEEANVAETVESLLALDYARRDYRVVVVADNCTDETAARAEAAGARVLVRDEPERRGKGHALAFAFERLLAEDLADGLVVVDADTVVSPNLLGAFAARLQNGAQALQARYDVRNPTDSWRTRLLHLAFTLFHRIRSQGRERLGLSCGLRGNGMAFTPRALRRVPHDAFSLVEDLEYGIRLGLAALRVQYVDEAFVLGEMPATEQATRSQRKRWEIGRWRMARQHAVPLLREALARRSVVLLDLGLDLLLPPLSYLVLATGVGLLAAVAGLSLGLHTMVAAVLWALAGAALGSYVARGIVVSGLGWQGVRDLMWAPVFVLWKLVFWLQPDPHAAGEWVRTHRGRRMRDGDGK